MLLKLLLLGFVNASRCQVRRRGDASLQGNGWTETFTAQMLIHNIVVCSLSPTYTSLFSTEDQIAKAMNEQFMHYSGHLVSSEIDLITADDVCPKPRWNDKTKTCDSISIDDNTDNGLFIFVFIIDIVLFLALCGTCYYFHRRRADEKEDLDNVSYLTESEPSHIYESVYGQQPYFISIDLPYNTHSDV